MTLGGLKQGVTPLDMAHAYETFAAGGERDHAARSAPATTGPVGIDVGARGQERQGRSRSNRSNGARRVLTPDVARPETADA